MQPSDAGDGGADGATPCVSSALSRDMSSELEVVARWWVSRAGERAIVCYYRLNIRSPLCEAMGIYAFHLQQIPTPIRHIFMRA